jgi:hypothetical protein
MMLLVRILQWQKQLAIAAGKTSSTQAGIARRNASRVLIFSRLSMLFS